MPDQHGSAHAQTHRGGAWRARQAGFRGPDVALHEVPAGTPILLRPGRCDPALVVQDLVPGHIVLVVEEYSRAEGSRLLQIVS